MESGEKEKWFLAVSDVDFFSGPALVITAAVVVVVAVVVVAIVVAAVVVVVVFFVFFFFGSNDIKMGDGDNIFENYLVMFFLLFY